MIRLMFTPPDSPTWHGWVTDCTVATNTLIQSFEEGAPIAITPLYREYTDHYRVHPFYGKCAYCESKVQTTSPDYVEHFRPKMGVRDLNNRVVNVSRGGRDIPHPGYYWLSYEWQNLLPTCWKCNTWHEDYGVKLGKGNRFPVDGTYAVNPGEEATENYQLINPVIEDPAGHIVMDNLGILHANGFSVKGATVIAFFGLNVREPLVNGRKKEYENMTRKLQLAYTMANDTYKQAVLDEIKNILKGQDEYTIAARKAVADVLSSAQSIEKQIAGS